MRRLVRVAICGAIGALLSIGAFLSIAAIDVARACDGCGPGCCPPPPDPVKPPPAGAEPEPAGGGDESAPPTGGGVDQPPGESPGGDDGGAGLPGSGDTPVGGSPSGGGGAEGGSPSGGAPGTGGGSPAGGAPTAGGGAGGARGPRSGGGGGLDRGHWSYWWYANRSFLLEESVRVGAHATRTPAQTDEGDDDDGSWREDVRRALAKAVAGGDDEMAAAAVLALGKAGSAADLALVRDTANDRGRRRVVRECATMALGLLDRSRPEDDARARETLLEIAGDLQLPDDLRAIAIYALGLRRDARVVPALVAWARGGGKSWDVPAAATSALGLSGCEDARAELERLLGRTRERGRTMRRVYAAHGLARLGSPASVPPLLAALSDDDAAVRRAAALAIGAVAKAGDAKAVDALVRVLDDDRERGCRGAAAVGLGRIGGADAVAALRRCYDRDDPSVRSFAAVALGLIGRATERPAVARDVMHDVARGPQPQMRGATYIAVGVAGAPGAAPPLRVAVGDGGDPRVVAQAASGLALVGDRETAPDLLRKLLHEANDPVLRGEATVALGMLGDVRTLSELSEMARSGRTDLDRMAACFGLGRIGGPQVAGVLIGILEDDDESALLRHVAARALGMLVDDSEGRRIGSIAADLDWQSLTPTVVGIVRRM